MNETTGIKCATNSIQQRRNFFAKQVKMPEWQNAMSGENESRVLMALKGLGYVLGRDFVRQYPMGERFVIDFAFINEQLAIEVDGEKHNEKRQKQWDKKRDSFLEWNNWLIIRIKDKDFFGYKGSFYKSLIKVVVEERREQWEIGKLYPIEIPIYEDGDYD